MTTNNNTFNVTGMQAGAISMGGNATQRGDNAFSYNPQTLSLMQSHLADAEREVKMSAALDMAAKKDALATIETARAEPTKDNLAKVVAALGNVESLATKALGAGTALYGIGKLIAQTAGIGG